MARAKPFPSAGTKTAFTPKRLAAHDVGAITACLKLSQMVASRGHSGIVDQVETALALYHAHEVHAEGPAGTQSASRKVATLSPLLELASKLQDGLRAVPAALRLELTHADGLPVTDTEIERIRSALEAAITRYGAEVKPGRRSVDEGLQSTVRALLSVFADHYNGNPSERDDDEREFIHCSLAAAGIPHPDPDTHGGEFSAILKRAHVPA